ncbi:MAG: glycosyltransferase [Bacteroidota bacterium]|nr:glycosyltransferase [Bacteroidota bacterium]
MLVNDGSVDSTSEVINNTDAIVITHPYNVGYGKSLKDGIKSSSNDIIFITDADGTYPIEKIPELLNEYKKGFNMVVGARQGKNYDGNFIKKINRKILKFLVEFTAGRKIPDINSGLRVFSKEESQVYFNTLCDTFSFTTSLTLAYLMNNKFVKYIPIEYHKRVGNTKVKLFKDSLRTLQYIVEAILFYNPIKIFIIFSIILIVLSVFSFGFTFLWGLKSTFMIGISCIFLSILMFGIGMIATILKQILHKI